VAPSTARCVLEEEGSGAARTCIENELIRLGYDGPEHERRPIPHTYIECHIEQGPILASAGVDVGVDVVTGVHSIWWQRLELRGAAAHAAPRRSSAARTPGWLVRPGSG
jgi:beta-ureidopropionase / N-carbamoyl-L-amino-acid hydrolase